MFYFNFHCPTAFISIAYVGLVLILLVILKLDSTSLPLFQNCRSHTYAMRKCVGSVDSLIASLNNYCGLGRRFCGRTAARSGRVLSSSIGVSPCRFYGRAHASWARTRIAARQRDEEKRKISIVIHPHCIIYGVSLLSPSAGVRPRDPYSGDLTSRD